MCHRIRVNPITLVPTGFKSIVISITKPPKFCLTISSSNPTQRLRLSAHLDWAKTAFVFVNSHFVPFLFFTRFRE